MQHHIVVMRVFVVSVQVPVARFVVYLNIPDPQRAVYAHLGIKEVGPRIAVVQPGVYHFHGLSVSGEQSRNGQYAVSPHVVQKLFHGGFYGLICKTT